MISLIAAMGKNRVIGKNGKLPWSFAEDMKWFRLHTMNKVIVMGSTTHESIGVTLPGRINVVLGPDNYKPLSGTTLCTSIEQVLDDYSGAGEIMFIGGQSIYHQTIGLADRLYLTTIHKRFDGDSYFPAVNFSKWKSLGVKAALEKGCVLTFDIYDRI